MLFFFFLYSAKNPDFFFEVTTKNIKQHNNEYKKGFLSTKSAY